MTAPPGIGGVVRKHMSENASSKPTASGQPDVKAPDPVELRQAMIRLAERGQKLVAEFIDRQATSKDGAVTDPFNIGGAFFEMTARMLADPARLMQAQV